MGYKYEEGSKQAQSVLCTQKGHLTHDGVRGERGFQSPQPNARPEDTLTTSGVSERGRAEEWPGQKELRGPKSGSKCHVLEELRKSGQWRIKSSADCK